MAPGADAGWGIVEWSVTTLAGALVFLAGLLWRVGTRVGAAMTRLGAVENEQRGIKADIKEIANGHHAIEKALAGLPDQIGQRFDKRFDDLNLRIDSVVDRR